MDWAVGAGLPDRRLGLTMGWARQRGFCRPLGKRLFSALREGFAPLQLRALSGASVGPVPRRACRTPGRPTAVMPAVLQRLPGGCRRVVESRFEGRAFTRAADAWQKGVASRRRFSDLAASAAVRETPHPGHPAAPAAAPQ